MGAREFYASEAVRSRIAEFLGGQTPEDSTAVYIRAGARGGPRGRDLPSREVWRCLQAGLDVARSLWDRGALVCHLDIDYINFARPAAAYVRPLRAFDLERPVVRAIEEVLAASGITPLKLMSGRGHHFVWSVATGSAAFESLRTLVPVAESLGGRYAVRRGPEGHGVGPSLAEAHAGLGAVMEYIAHRALARAGPRSRVPVRVTEVEPDRPGPPEEIVSVDISEYADPLYLRAIGVPFGAYLKPRRERAAVGEAVADSLPAMLVVPAVEADASTVLRTMRDPRLAEELAGTTRTWIPDGSEGTASLVRRYGRSELAAFHRRFYSEEHAPPARWHRAYDLPARRAPPCVRRILARPNDLLLKPAGIRHVVEGLLSRGWHPRRVAGLVRSLYERDFGWGDRWYRDDATSRADFYVRLFAGLALVGPDSSAGLAAA